LLAFHTATHGLTPTAIAAVRISLAVPLPIPALILSSLISANHKAILVFWRFKHPLLGVRTIFRLRRRINASTLGS